MRTTDLFKSNRSAKKLNESLQKTFGKHVDLKSMDLPRLEDARNKLRTQIHDARSQSGFNENLENETLTQAQWMLDAINAEIIEREEFVSDPHQATVSEESDDFQDEFDNWMHSEYAPLDDEAGDDNLLMGKAMAFLRGMVSPNQIEDAAEILVNMYYGEGDGEPSDSYDSSDDADALASAGFGSDEDYGYYGQDESVAMEKAPPGGKYERMVKHIKKGYAKDGKLSDKEKSIAYATAWKQKNKDTNESVTTGEEMTRLNEGEIQQASAIVNAKTMVDRVGRWIEELSGMENDTLLQLGDSIRDEMSSELAKSFISSVAPAIQQALETLKGTRETLASGVRMLTGEEQGAEMLGNEPAAPADEFGGEAEPDMMNAGGEEELGGPSPDDAFAAAEPGAGGLETAGREQRESIERSNNLLKILAG